MDYEKETKFFCKSMIFMPFFFLTEWIFMNHDFHFILIFAPVPYTAIHIIDAFRWK